jgi:glutamine synthetase
MKEFDIPKCATLKWICCIMNTVQLSEVKGIINERDISMIGVSWIDIEGIPRMKPLINKELDSILKKGTRVTKANFAVNILETLTPDSKVNVSQGELELLPDLSTFTIPSYTPDTARFIGDLYERDGSVSQLCTRSVYRRVLEKTMAMGYHFTVGLESEFYLLIRQGTELTRPYMSRLQSQEGYNIYHDIIPEMVAALRSVNVEAEGLHVEGGSGQLEIDLAYQDGLKAADDFIYAKDALRAVARKHEWMASFMPKIRHDWWGNGLHMHVNLKNMKGANVFYDKADKRGLGLSKLCYNFLGGILYHMKALCAVTAPIVNSYKRILPGRWNADAIMYGAGHRGAAVRIPDARGKGTRLECRFPDGACNPYLAMACILEAGLDGIKRELDPGKPVDYDITFLTDLARTAKGLELMPRSLHEALIALQKDDLFRKTMGDFLF